MPHKYEREIEEILRNFERTEPRRGFGDRVRASQRPTIRATRPRRTPSLSSSLLVIGIALALISAGMAFTLSFSQPLLTGILGAVGFLCFAAGMVLGWWARFRGVKPVSRPVRDNVVTIGPSRRGFFAEIATQARILRLKLRYWRMREH